MFDIDYARFRAAVERGAFGWDEVGAGCGFGKQKTAMMAAACLNHWKLHTGMWSYRQWKKHARTCGYVAV